MNLTSFFCAVLKEQLIITIYPPSLQQWELSTKLLLNAVSTGAHILKGKAYQNHMIDVQVTNSKLYCRATRLLQVCKNHFSCPLSSENYFLKQKIVFFGPAKLFHASIF